MEKKGLEQMPIGPLEQQIFEDQPVDDMYADIMVAIISSRKKQGITPEKLAAKAGINADCEKNFERFDVVPHTTVETLCKILVALGLKIKIEP